MELSHEQVHNARQLMLHNIPIFESRSIPPGKMLIIDNRMWVNRAFDIKVLVLRIEIRDQVKASFKKRFPWLDLAGI